MRVPAAVPAAVLALLLALVLTACGSDEAEPGGSSTSTQEADTAFATELMHRDAALLNLLDVGLGRELDPAVVATTDQLRLETVDRLEAAADAFEEWGLEPPTTVRDHGADHSSDADVPTLEGMPTGDDLQELGQLRRSQFEGAFVLLLTGTLEATCDLARTETGGGETAAALAEQAAASCEAALAGLPGR